MGFDMLMHFNYFLFVCFVVCWYMLLSFYECESTIASVLGLFASEFDGCGLICIFFAVVSYFSFFSLLAMIDNLLSHFPFYLFFYWIFVCFFWMYFSNEHNEFIDCLVYYGDQEAAANGMQFLPHIHRLFVTSSALFCLLSSLLISTTTILFYCLQNET